MDAPESALLSAFLLLILLGIMACGDVSRHFGLEQAISACVGIAAVVCGDAAGSVAGLALSPLVTAHTSGVVEAAMMVSVIAVVTVRLFVFTEWDLAELFLGDGALLTADQVLLLRRKQLLSFQRGAAFQNGNSRFSPICSVEIQWLA